MFPIIPLEQLAAERFDTPEILKKLTASNNTKTSPYPM